MSQKKARGSTGVTYKSKAAKQEVSVQQASGNKVNTAPVLAVIIAMVVFFGIVAYQSTQKSGANQAATNGATTATTLAAQMQGVEIFNAVAASAINNALTTTFKMNELRGSDCVQTIGPELEKLGKIGQVRADYSNGLLEVQRDATIKDTQIIDALIKSQHSGNVTTEKIVDNGQTGTQAATQTAN
ncbi:MAG TPA: hypothetical protein VGK02_05145 [Candidatus Aquicultor sp.]|jgi:hypothetical protein